ncbi:hypothetical protein HMPREF9318_01277 [Streptococcus urinalis FB127-CNA-2]|uniref:hypothetical protein n=1 Tax=Streptococcus urinalis TaxID=149016 RepID=UPI000225C2AC|nr:hypothetical protein [Streptococcus urinalis]EKS19755.1 hypothetical protein HMPREF9318_01277 [Streptococcus urinalis FB127-CNA-2]VEF31332.1 Uncharacterised protein [Streptococcus urinalis]
MKDGKYGGLSDSQVDSYLKKLSDYKEGYYTFGSIERILNEAKATHDRQWGNHRFAIPNSQR